MKRSTRIGIIVVAGATVGALLAFVLLPVNVPVTGWLFGSTIGLRQDADLRERVSLPPGYRINIYATGIEDARMMQLTSTGDLLVTSTDTGELILVRRDADGDGRGDGLQVLEAGLNLPHGIWLDGNELFVAEEHQVIRYRYESQARTIAAKTIVLSGLPQGDGHHTRTVKKGPDGWYYVAVGSSCNVCQEEHDWRAAIIRFKADADIAEVFATGLRNTVDFDWHPDTGRMYGVDNGRDWLGDDFPPDELNQISRGGFYGWPYFNGDNVPDEDLGASAAAASMEPVAPAHMFAAHVAPLGLTFLKHQAGTSLEGAAMVGQHGSWNRTTKIGYRVVSLHWDDKGAITQKTFAEGFERNGDVIGRPVQVIESPDGMLFVSDDYAGAVYRIVRTDDR